MGVSEWVSPFSYKRCNIKMVFHIAFCKFSYYNEKKKDGDSNGCI